MKQFAILVLVIAPALVFGQGQQQERQPRSLGPLEFEAAKISAPPEIDGTIGDGEWTGAASFTGFLNGNHQPERGKTSFFLTYDERYVYFAARVAESHPPKATITGTNVSIGVDDYISFQLDTFGEGKFQDFNRCVVNANGATSFYKAGGSAQKREWLGEFEAKGRPTVDGWEVEARVPWEILRIPKSGVRDLRFNFYRSDTKTEEGSSYYQPRDNDPNTGAIWKGVDVPVVHTKNLWKYLGSVNAAAGRGRSDLKPSLDVRGFLNDKYELSAVLFPDFSLINRVASFIGFSHYEVLLPETRPLFQEGSGYFGGTEGIFASQRIRRFDLGMRFYGSPTPKSKLGINNTIAFDGEETLAASYEQSLNSRDTVLMGVTSLRSHSQASNEALAAQYAGMRGPWYFSASSALTSDQEEGVGASFSGYAGYHFGNFGTSGGFSNVDRRFFPRLGYAPETGVRGVNASVNYGYYVDRQWLSSATVGIFHSHYWETGGRLAHESTSLSTGFDIRQALGFYAGASLGSFAGVPEKSASFGLNFPNSSRASWGVYLNTAFYNSGPDDSVLHSIDLSYRDPHSKWSLSGGLTQYRAQTTAMQRSLSFSYKLTPYETLSLAYLNDQGKSNGSIQYGRRNNRGIEYFVALGDPSAETFTPAIVARVMIPFR